MSDTARTRKRIPQITPRPFQVTQNAATEPTFDNEFWDKYEAGGHVRRCGLGEPMFPPLTSSKAVVAGRVTHRSNRVSTCGRPQKNPHIGPDSVEVDAIVV